MRKSLCAGVAFLAAAWIVPVLPGTARAESDEPQFKKLDATNIEGEIRLPQVLFITSRESFRPLDFLDWYGAMTPYEIGIETPLPNQIHVVRHEELEG